MLKAGLDAEKAFIGNHQGDVRAAIAGAAKKIEAVYSYPFQNHAAMEPMNATALYTPDKCEVWTSTQNGEAALAAASEAAGLAHAAGQDALEFRRKLMAKHPKHLAVLNAVAEKIGWGQPAPQGVYRGLAQQMGYGSYVAAAAEVTVTNGNKIKIHRIVGATDPGHAVNPAQIDRQVAGSFVYGLSALFYGECTVKDGRIEQTNFDTYNSMRIAEMPKVEAIVMPSGGFWGGVGEPTIFVAAPAVLNAFFAATGKRIRAIPLKNHNISFA
jgi:isoquinoline 1-oxidoreductase subunit beta